MFFHLEQMQWEEASFMRENIGRVYFRIGFVGWVGAPISLEKVLPGAVCYYFQTPEDFLYWHRRCEINVVVVSVAAWDHYANGLEPLKKELFSAPCGMDLSTQSAEAPSVILLAPNGCATSWFETGGVPIIPTPVDPSALASCIAARAQSARHHRLWRLFEEVADAYRPEFRI